MGPVAQLQVYNRRADRLTSSSFWRQVRDRHTVFRLHGGPFRVVREGAPDHEAMEAFVLTFRLFVQDRDGLSFRKIDELYQSLPVSQELKETVRACRAFVNAFLDSPSPIVILGREISRRELMNSWLNGEVAHANAEHIATLSEWDATEDIAPFFQFEFEVTIIELFGAIARIAQANKQAIAELAAAAGPSAA